MNKYLFFETSRKYPTNLIFTIESETIWDAIVKAEYIPFSMEEDFLDTDENSTNEAMEVKIKAVRDWYGLNGRPYWKSGNGDDHYGNFIVEIRPDNTTACYGYCTGKNHFNQED